MMNTDEADAVLSILEKRAADLGIAESDWDRLFETEPYIRLKKREAVMKRDFTDEEFREFVLSDDLVANAESLADTLEKWASVDLSSPIAKAMAYLPEGSTIRAKVYPVIKPMTNSFVFEITTDPAIFMYLDPEVTPDKLANTLAHEFHHIGFGGNCPSEATKREIDALPDETAWIAWRLRAFGEGFAMLAAAGGPKVHPHEVSPEEERNRWDDDMSRFEEDLRKVEAFVAGSVDGSLADEEKQKIFRSFYGEQGPWYTVGWKMAVTIEEQLGRQALLDAFCDPRELLATYNRAAAKQNQLGEERLPLWTEALVDATRGRR
ncbi:MAG: hypothetical protein GY769_08865 [bacterium]|nr:hypothetical protein [bacterium]